MSSQGPIINPAAPATFTIVKSNGSYTAVPVDAGKEFAPGDFITVTGDQLGGSTPANDALVTVSSITGADNTINTLTVGGSAKTVYTIQLPVETTATFSITKSGTSYSVTRVSDGSNFRVNDFVVISGTSLGGSTPANDATVTVTSVSGTGAITGLSVTGTAITSYTVALSQANAPAGFTQPQPGGGGIVAQPTITKSGSGYSLSFPNNYLNDGTDDGRGYTGGPLTFKLKGSVLGGADTTNDATIVCNVGSGVGELQFVSISGVSASNTFTPLTMTAGSPATIQVDVSGLTSYTVGSISVTTAGTRYVADQSYTIDGARLGGTSSTHDLTFLVDTVNGSGALLTVKTVSGTAKNTYTPFTFPNTNYRFRQIQLRDSSEWIAMKRQTRIYKNYKPSSTDNKDTGTDSWSKFGNGFRLDYLLGRYKSRVAVGNGFEDDAPA